ncbi:24013_t:CDS:2, partial [Dentiscutata erythropus]
ILSGTSLSSKSSIKPIIGTTKTPIQKTKSISKVTSIKDDDDIDDFLKSLEDEDVKPLPRSNNIKKQSIRKVTDKTSRKSKSENEMEEWLDDVLK